jgi:hypothetical protein
MGKRRYPSLTFEDGVLCAMAVLAYADQETYWREVMETCGGWDILRRRSKANGNLESDGFLRYTKDRRYVPTHGRRRSRPVPVPPPNPYDLSVPLDPRRRRAAWDARLIDAMRRADLGPAHGGGEGRGD